MKNELVARLSIETEAGKRYIQKAIAFAEEGKTSKAWNLLDIARQATLCANQVHEELWEVSKGNLTDEEFEIFAEAETLCKAFKHAVQAVKTAMRK